MEKFTFNVQIKDVEKVNSTFSKCKIYMCYADLNRNNSIIPRNVIDANLRTLYNCPILGEYDKKKNDFLDHGGKVELGEDGDLEYVCTTMPYGVVPESSDVKWEFVDGKDYLTCTGYLWTGRYPEAMKAIEESRPQSMEIDNVQGSFDKSGKFEVTNFEFSGLCILGTEVEPCFESAKITAYSLNDFKHEFSQMVEELNKSINQNPDDVQHEHNQDFSYATDKEEKLVLKKSEIAAQFKLTSSQLYSEMERELCEVTYKTTNWYGEECERCRYYLNDFDETYAYIVDCQNGYMDMKVPYSMNGDNVSFDFEQAKRIKYSPVDWEGGNEEGADDSDEGMGTFAAKLDKEVEEFFAKKKSEFEIAVSEKEDAVLEMGKKYAELETQFTTIQESIQEKDFKIQELAAQIQQYQKVEEDEKVKELFKEFAVYLSEEDKNELLVKRESIESFDSFKKEVKSFVCDKVLKFSKENKSNFISMALPDEGSHKDEVKKESTHWDRLANQN